MPDREFHEIFNSAIKEAVDGEGKPIDPSCEEVKNLADMFDEVDESED